MVLRRLNTVTGYMLYLFRKQLATKTKCQFHDQQSPPIGMDEMFAEECRAVTLQMVRAFLNPVGLSWDVDAYRMQCAKQHIWSGMQPKESNLAHEFPSCRSGIRAVRGPRTVVDKYGRIVMWILPDILPPRIQLAMRNGGMMMSSDFKTPSSSQQTGGSWRYDPSLFSEMNDGLPPGVLNISAAWFMNGWEGRQDGLITSPFLAKESGQEWMTAFFEPGAVISGILRIMHPDQYRMGFEILSKLALYAKVEEALLQWPSIFNAITVISNRHCPMHRDTKGAFHLFDILVTSGEYTTAPLIILPIGLQVPNSAGTILGFSGAAFRHGVAPADGTRLCHAFYMRVSLQSFTDTRPCSWMTQEVYRDCLGEENSAITGVLHLDPMSI
ncbi:hypothetical protein QCA50_000862 [Cerrena zonata]|uniref:2OGFeDO JBP1/TET oxygenase domain-containing protein n=1 Tax=Cerrena zonata TaxID=2478898 RepID=A0AAW0GVR0_9APHY